MKNNIWKACLFGMLILLGLVVCRVSWINYMSTKKTTYIVGVPLHWHTLIPPLQHSFVGSLVMINQYEALVNRVNKGILDPLASKSWVFSSDRTKLHFKIDTSRRFSDGSFLCAADFKRSWEDGLKMKQKSSNSSLADVFTNLKGFSEFKNKGHIEGIRVLSEDILELEFKKPVRSAVDHLSGIRYSAYKIVGGHPIGTGPYIITEEDNVLTLVPNPYYVGKKPALKNVKIVVVPPEDALEKFKSGEIDIFFIAEIAELSGCSDGKLKPIKCIYGQEGSHSLIILNGIKGRFFANPFHRSAFQSLILSLFDKTEARWPQEFRKKGFLYESQSFLKFQSGRISDVKAKKIINEGEQYIPQLIKATQKHPIVLHSGQNCTWLIDFLKKKGLKLSKNSRINIDGKETLSMIYKTFKPDIMPIKGSVSVVDPDGLYHMLGRNGAIFSPMLERKGVADKLENGRQLIDPLQLPSHYREVSRKILEEVPYVHMGYFYKMVAYNSDRVMINETFLNRNNQSITVFESK